MEQNSDDKPKTRAVETYTDDMVKVLEGDKGGMIKKIIHEEEKKEMEKKNLSPESARNKVFMITGVALLSLAAVAIVFSLILGEKIATAPVEPQFVPLIFIDKNSYIETADLDEKKMPEALISKIISSDVKKGGIEGIYFTENKSLMGFQAFMSKIKGNYPSSAAGFTDDNFLVGMVNGEQKNLFILLKVKSFADIFPRMREWEGKMFSDLGPLFARPLGPDTAYLLTKDFEDGIAANKNARILRDKAGNIVLMYVFADDNSIIITDSISAASEVMTRLSGSKVRK